MFYSTLMSAAACMAGLFPPSDNQIWNSKLNWQPVPVFNKQHKREHFNWKFHKFREFQIHTEPRHEDVSLAPEKQCDRYEYEMIEYTNSSEYKSIFEKNKLLIKYLEENSGEMLHSLKSVFSLYDQLYIEQLKGKHLPLWAKKVLEKESGFEDLANFVSTIFTRTSKFKQLRAGFLAKEILDRSRQKMLSKLSPDRSMWMYFAHSSTINDMLNSLGLQQVWTLTRTLHTKNWTLLRYLAIFFLFLATPATICVMPIFWIIQNKNRKLHSTVLPKFNGKKCSSTRYPRMWQFEMSSHEMVWIIQRYFANEKLRRRV